MDATLDSLRGWLTNDLARGEFSLEGTGEQRVLWRDGESEASDEAIDTAPDWMLL